MKYLILFGSILMLAVSVYAEEVGKQPIDYWSQVLDAHDFNNILAVFQTGPAIEWPAVHSVRYDETTDGSAVMTDTEFRRLGEMLVEGLKDYERELQTGAAEQFCNRAEALLSMRDHFLHHVSYFNLILVDSINRILYVNLAERLALADEITPCLLSLMKHLDSFRPDLLSLKSIVEEELNTIIANDGAYRSATDAERLKILWAGLGPEATSFQLMPRSVLDLPTDQLMKKQNIPALVNRLVRSDFYIHSLLPALIEYRQKDQHYSPMANYQQIQTVLGRDAPLPDSLGIRPFGASSAASAVDELLHDVQSGKMQKQLFFSLSEILGKSLVE